MSENLQTGAIMAALRPIQHLLESGEDVAINEPGRAWHYCSGHWSEHIIPELTERRCRGIALLAEAQRRPEKRNAIISVDLPTSHRGEFILPPATAGGRVIICLRRPDATLSELESVPTRFQTARWNKWLDMKQMGRPGMAELIALWDAGDLIPFLTKFAQMRLTAVLCGETGVGKSSLLNTLLSLMPNDFRMVVVEDAAETVLRQRNVARVLFQKGGVTPEELIIAAMRLRPTVIPVSELRTPEATYVFVNQASTGHRGSPTTVHGHTAKQAGRRIFNLVKGSSAGRNMDDKTVVDDIGNSIDLILPVENCAGVRSFGEAWFAPDAARRGETFQDLVFSGD